MTKLSTIVVVAILVAVMVFMWNSTNPKRVCDDYGCILDRGDKRSSKDTMDEIQKRTNLLMDYLVDHTPSDKLDGILFLSKRYKPRNMYEIDPYNLMGYTSYVVDKGAEYGICMRKMGGGLSDVNDTMYVHLHEMAHLCTRDYDNHNAEFLDYFGFLLESAIKLGLYKYADYNKHPVFWCNMKINATPYDFSELQRKVDATGASPRYPTERM